MSTALLETLRSNLKGKLDERAAAQTELDSLTDKVADEKRSAFSEDETTKFNELRAALDAADTEITGIRAQVTEFEARDAAKSEAEKILAEIEPEIAREVRKVDPANVRVTSEPRTYTKENRSVSYFRDLVLSKAPGIEDPDASARILRHRQENDVELRANMNRTDGTGGEFVPPLWLVNEYVPLARAARTTADRCTKMTLPGKTDSINVPKVSTGTAVANQTADGATVQKTDMTTSTVTAPVVTIAGQQVFSLQLFEQSAIPFDQVVFQDLIAAYATQVDTQVLNGSGASGQVTGILQTSGITTVTYTDASPTVPELYPFLAQATNAVQVNRFLPPTAVVLHNRRWNWELSTLDSSNRPLVVPVAQGPYMAEGVMTDVLAEGGPTGYQMGLPLYVDPNIPITLGGGTEDRIIFGRFTDAWLFESALKSRVLFETDADTLSVRLQVYAYVAFTAARFPKSFAVISGTGLAQPSGF